MQVLLTATAISGLGPLDAEVFAPGSIYHVFGAGAAEVEVDVLTVRLALLSLHAGMHALLV